MNCWKKSFLFALGGLTYMGLELLWRGWSHGSMFLAGGVCFLLLGKLQALTRHMSAFVQGLLGAGIITLVEYTFGLFFNRKYTVWDYRDMPLHLHGQICLPFSILWLPISLGAMYLYRLLDKKIQPVK